VVAPVWPRCDRWVQLIEGSTVNYILQPRVLVQAIVDQADACPTD